MAAKRKTVFSVIMILWEFFLAGATVFLIRSFIWHDIINSSAALALPLSIVTSVYTALRGKAVLGKLKFNLLMPAVVTVVSFVFSFCVISFFLRVTKNMSEESRVETKMPPMPSPKVTDAVYVDIDGNDLLTLKAGDIDMTIQWDGTEAAEEALASFLEVHLAEGTVVVLNNDRNTSYESYIEVYLVIEKAFKELSLTPAIMEGVSS